MNDTRLTIRLLLKSPLHVLTVCLCLGVGIAVTVTVFSIINSILSGEMPGVVDGRRIVRLFVTAESFGPRAFIFPSLSDHEILREAAWSRQGGAIQRGPRCGTPTFRGADRGHKPGRKEKRFDTCDAKRHRAERGAACGRSRHQLDDGGAAHGAGDWLRECGQPATRPRHPSDP